MATKKHETIHVHIPTSRPALYVIFLLIPSVIFVFILAFWFRYKDNAPSAVNTFSDNQILGQEEQLKSIYIDGVEIKAEVADNEIEVVRGLSGRENLPADQGLLFVFPRQNVQPPFWMKEMKIPIDIIWINDGEVSQIHEYAEPQPGVSEQELKLYLPNEPIDYVLEVNAGFSSDNAINVGDGVDLSEAL